MNTSALLVGQNKFHCTGIGIFFYIIGTLISTVIMVNKAHNLQHLFWGMNTGYNVVFPHDGPCVLRSSCVKTLHVIAQPDV